MADLPLVVKNQWISLLRFLERCRAKAPDKSTVHYALSVLLFCALIGLHYSVKGFLFAPSAGHTAMVMALALVFFFIRYETTPRAFRILLRSLTVIATLYAAVASNNASPSQTAEGLEAFNTPGTLRLIAVLFGIFGLIRPTLGLPAFFYPVWQHTLLQDRFGFPIAQTGFIGFAELGLLLILGLIVATLVNLKPLAELLSSPGTPTTAKRLSTLEVMVLGVVAVHLGHYFWSAVGHAMLDGGMLSWIVENKTHYAMLTALAVGSLPISFSATLVGWTHELMSHAYVLFNAVMLAGQILAIILVMGRRSLSMGLWFYITMHLFMFALTGILAWQWMLINMSLLLALRAIPRTAFPRLVQILLLLLVLLGKQFFTITEPSRYDTRAVNLAQLYAVTREGQPFPVPTNYLLAASQPFAHMEFAYTEKATYPTGPWGTTGEIEIMKRANECALPRNGVPRQAPFNAEHLDQFLRRHHAYILQHVDDSGRLLYDLHPHQIWSMPWAFQEFQQLDKRLIKEYWWVTQVACLDFKDGKFTKDVLGEQVRVIKIGG